MPALSFTSLSLTNAVIACFGFASSFVLSLYLADVGLPRDHPTTIRRRIFAVSMFTICSPLALTFLADNTLTLSSTLTGLGLKWTGVMPSTVLPIVLVLLLYLGPILQEITAHTKGGLLSHVLQERKDIVIRNYLIAPIAEEVVFRGCMIPLLHPHLSFIKTVVLTPLFFGVAHFHHMLEHVRTGTLTFPQALVNGFVQLTYTSLFGMFSAYLYLRTGHLLSPIIAHILCNILGLPEMWTVHRHRYRILVGVAYFIGLGSFLYFLPILTSPHFYY